MRRNAATRRVLRRSVAEYSRVIHRLNFRLIFALLLLAALAALQIAREDRPSILATGQRLRAYVANSADGTISVLDLAALSPVGTVSVGRVPSAISLRPGQNEIWGVAGGAGDDGYVWVLNAFDNKISARIAIGSAPAGIEFARDGKRAWVSISGANSLL